MEGLDASDLVVAATGLGVAAGVFSACIIRVGRGSITGIAFQQRGDPCQYRCVLGG